MPYEEDEHCDEQTTHLICEFFEKFADEQFRRDVSLKKLLQPSVNQLINIRAMTGQKKQVGMVMPVGRFRLNNLHKSTTTSLLSSQMQPDGNTDLQQPNRLQFSQYRLDSDIQSSKKSLASSTRAFADLVGASSNVKAKQNLRATLKESGQEVNIFGYSNSNVKRGIPADLKASDR